LHVQLSTPTKFCERLKKEAEALAFVRLDDKLSVPDGGA
jgi:hypothetical protein